MAIVSDQIGDFLTRIRNAATAGHKYVSSPRSKMKVEIAKILKDQGFIEDYEEVMEGPQGEIKVAIRYYKKQPSFNEIKRISKPGRRMYANTEEIPQVRNGLGIAILSTSKGIMSGKSAKKENVGGEVICTVW